MKNLALSKYSKLICLSLVCLFLFNTEVFAQRKKLEKERKERQKREKAKKNTLAKLDSLPSAFVFQWQFASRNTTKLPALATSDTVYLPLDDGRVIALESQNGQLRWETQPGGKIISPLIATDEQVYISSRLETENGSEGVLRVINRRSGLTSWTKNFTYDCCHASTWIHRDQSNAQYQNSCLGEIDGTFDDCFSFFNRRLWHKLGFHGLLA